MQNTYATFTDPAMAEKAAGALLDHGIRSEHLSILLPSSYRSPDWNKDTDGGKMEQTAKQGITTTTVGDAAKGSVQGAGVGLVAGTVAALAAVLIPGVGLVLGGGALAIALAGMAGSTVAGAIAGGAAGYLVDMGVPTQATQHFSEVLDKGGAMITVSPTDEHIDYAQIEAVLVKYSGNVSTYPANTLTVGTMTGQMPSNRMKVIP